LRIYSILENINTYKVASELKIMVIAKLRYSGYSAREWTFWMGFYDDKENPIIVRAFRPTEYKVGEFWDKGLMGEFYIKRNGEVWTAVRASSNPVERLRAELGELCKAVRPAQRVEVKDEVKRPWGQIYQDKNSPPTPFAKA